MRGRTYLVCRVHIDLRRVASALCWSV
ncbi:putative leader peptide [Frankia sp. Cas3]